MSGIRTASTARPWTGAALVALLVALLAAGACGAPKVTKRQTDIMEKAGTVSVSAAVLRVGVNDLVDRFAGRIEQSADRIVEQADTAAVRQRALALKVDAIPMVYTAGFRADPLSAAVDVWVLAFQFREYVETGAGRTAFGPQQGLLQETAREQLADVDAVMRTIAIKPEYFDRARPQVEQWAAAHPIEHTFAGRTSGASLLTSLRSDRPGRLSRRGCGLGHPRERVRAAEHVRGAPAEAGPVAGRAPGDGDDDGAAPGADAR